MRVFAISVCHMKPEIVAYSLSRARLTAGFTPDKWIMVNNCWPIDPYATTTEIEIQSNKWRDVYVKADKNEGWLEGFRLGLKEIHLLGENDLVLSYDPDSNPKTPGWLSAMVEAMLWDQSLTHVSLLHEDIADRDWETKKSPCKYHLVNLSKEEMFNITLWRGSFILSGGMSQGGKYYGFVETKTDKRNHAYLYGYREEKCPVPHEPRYEIWKRIHASGEYTKNFSDYVLEHPV